LGRVVDAKLTFDDDMAKRKQPPERSPSPNPKRLREAGIKFVILPPDALTIKSYGEDDMDELKVKASAQLEFLMNQAAILRDSPPPYVLSFMEIRVAHKLSQPTAKDQSSQHQRQGEGQSNKGKGQGCSKSSSRRAGLASGMEFPAQEENTPVTVQINPATTGLHRADDQGVETTSSKENGNARGLVCESACLSHHSYD
jgi:hypothetical protein